MPVSSYIAIQLIFNIPACLVLIEPSLKPDFGILGITFLENFTQFYSITHNQFALAPNNQATAKIINADLHQTRLIIGSVAACIPLYIIFMIISVRITLKSDDDLPEPNQYVSADAERVVTQLAEQAEA